jgi:hypothetical protein
MVRDWNLVGSDECYVLTSGTDNSRSMRGTVVGWRLPWQKPNRYGLIWNRSIELDLSIQRGISRSFFSGVHASGQGCDTAPFLLAFPLRNRTCIDLNLDKFVRFSTPALIFVST